MNLYCFISVFNSWHSLSMVCLHICSCISKITWIICRYQEHARSLWFRFFIDCGSPSLVTMVESLGRRNHGRLLGLAGQGRRNNMSVGGRVPKKTWLAGEVQGLVPRITQHPGGRTLSYGAASCPSFLHPSPFTLHPDSLPTHCHITPPALAPAAVPYSHRTNTQHIARHWILIKREEY